MDFEWDSAKAEANLTKHGVPFAYATRVFDDAYRLARRDPRKDYGEERHIVMGQVDARLLVVVCTWRSDDVCRLISARKANDREKKLYRAFQTRPGEPA